MSYVAGGKTYDEGGNEIDAYGNKLGGVDANKSNQALSASAANMGGGATIEDYQATQAKNNPYLPSGGSGAQSSLSDPRLNDLYNTLVSRSNQSLTVDANDPNIKSQVDAASVAGQRSLLDNQKAAAARGGAYATGAVANSARMGAEALGENLQGITAGAIGNEVSARRTEIAQALSGELGVLTLDQQTKLKQEDQALASRQLDLQTQQQSWMQAFQQKGFTADQAQILWQEMFNQRGQDLSQNNTVWDQNWKTSGGA